MKRILPLILTVLLLPALLAVPAMADETGTWVDVLKFSTVNESGDNYFRLLAGNNQFYYTLPTKGVLREVDLLVKADKAINTVSLCRINATNASDWMGLTVNSLGDNIYRIYGKVTANYAWENLWFRFNVDSNTHLDILSLRISFVNTTSFDASCVGIVYNYDTNPVTEETISYAGDNISKTVNFDHAMSYNATYLADLTLYDWQRYDYMDLLVFTNCLNVGSIDVQMGGEAVPFETSVISSAGDDNVVLYIVSIRVDLTKVNRATYKTLIVHITGSLSKGSAGNFGITSCKGLILAESMDPVTYWFTQLRGWFDELITVVGGGNDASGVQDNINAAVGELDQVQNVMDGVTRPELDAIDFDVSGLVDISAAATYGNIFSTLIDNQYMFNILMIAFILAAASFLLFGRR